jgi:hypothetical protein
MHHEILRIHPPKNSHEIFQKAPRSVATLGRPRGPGKTNPTRPYSILPKTLHQGFTQIERTRSSAYPPRSAPGKTNPTARKSRSCLDFGQDCVPIRTESNRGGAGATGAPPRTTPVIDIIGAGARDGARAPRFLERPGDQSGALREAVAKGKGPGRDRRPPPPDTGPGCRGPRRKVRRRGRSC